MHSALLYLSIGVLAISGLIWCGCSDQHPMEPSPIQPDRDRLRVRITNGVYLQLDSMKSVYSLDERIHGHLVIVNESDSVPYIQQMSGPPSHFFLVADRYDSLVYFYPLAPGLSESTDTLNVGDRIAGKINWTQNIWSATDMISGLKAFSGTYRIDAGFFRTGRAATKWITLSESGNPLSSAIQADYESVDSVLFVFVLRNRITQPLNHALRPDPFVVTFTQNHDTVLVEHVSGVVPLPIPPASDNIVFRYGRAITDSAFAGFSGSYDITGEVRFQDTTVTGTTFFWF